MLQGGTRSEGVDTRAQHRQERKRVDGGEGPTAARNQFFKALRESRARATILPRFAANIYAIPHN